MKKMTICLRLCDVGFDTIAIVIQVLDMIQRQPTARVERHLPDKSRESQADVQPSVLPEVLLELFVEEIQ